MTESLSTSSRSLLYQGQSLLADPIHSYIPFTVPYGENEETTEKDLIDSEWMQRLRYIYQLQSARWVYPSAEHSRFVHSIGAMHVAGRFAKHLYPSLKDVESQTPSPFFIEALLRTAVLLHDIGHGPFCHFFDHNVLHPINLTHEKLGQAIICQKLGPLIENIKRSPSGPFQTGEQINPEHVAFLIHKDKQFVAPAHYPRWLVLLKPLLSGLFTADNLDYVLRDSFMCGLSVGPVDIDRLIHYSFFTQQGLSLHQSGLPALTMFLNARSYLYFNVYHHRTTRALDIHMKDIFKATLEEIFPHSPLERLNDYVDLTDWSLLLKVKSWKRSRTTRKIVLFEEWNKLLLRKVKWKMAYHTTLSFDREDQTKDALDAHRLEIRIRQHLPEKLSAMPFRVDIARQDPRPSDPIDMGDRQLFVFNPSTEQVSKEALMPSLRTFPVSLAQCRIYALDHSEDPALSLAAEKALSELLSAESNPTLPLHSNTP